MCVYVLSGVSSIEDVESEVRLALLDNQIALLDMDPMAVKTYNIMQAIIAVNAVDSEREHQVSICADTL